MRSMLGNAEHASRDVQIMHLREESISKNSNYKPRDNSHLRDDKELAPAAIWPPTQPIIHRTFDWYAGDGNNIHLTGQNFEGKWVGSSKPVRRIKQAKTSLESLGLRTDTRYYYKLFVEDRRAKGTLKEIGKEGTFVTFQKFQQGYYSNDCVRWTEISHIWNASGSEEIYNHATDTKLQGKDKIKREKMEKAMENLKNRESWKHINTLVRSDVTGLVQSRLTECSRTTLDNARAAEFETMSPLQPAKVCLLKSHRKSRPEGCVTR